MNHSGGSATRLALLGACQRLRGKLEALRIAKHTDGAVHRTTHVVLRTSIPHSSNEVQQALSNTALYPQARFYSVRDGRVLMAFGARHLIDTGENRPPASCLQQGQQARTERGGRLWFALRFTTQCHSAKQATCWDAFGNGLAFLPRFEFECRGQHADLLLHCSAGQPDEFDACDTAIAALEDAARNTDDERATHADGIAADTNALHDGTTRSAAEYARYVDSVQNALAKLHEDTTESLAKVVLARRSWLPYAGSGAQLIRALERLETEDARGASYYFAPAPRRCFFGRTPELLFAYDSTSIWTEAVAGTRPRGENGAEDEAFENELRSSPKESLEHHLVKAHIEEVLTGLGFICRSESRAEVRRLSRVMHLVSPICAERPPANQSTSASEDQAAVPSSTLDHTPPHIESWLGNVLARLHPTPALAGTPRDEALDFLQTREGFDRGLYAGPCGFLEEGRGEIWIALRGGVWQADEITLFAGAGIVPGSTPHGEWQETEAKMSALREVLRESQ